MEAVLLLGGNIGDVGATLSRAESLINTRVGRVLSCSRDHWTEPWGFQDERLFLNRALLVGTQLAPDALLKEGLAIERELGRTRDSAPGYSARTIDIDLLFVGDLVIEQPGLVVPHPRLQERAFALAPVADVAPDLVHPLFHRTVLNLLNDVLRTT